VEDRALAGAVAAEQHDELPVADGERGAMHHLRLAVGDVEVGDLEQGLARWSGVGPVHRHAPR
jgi:hypothetical protein